MDGPSVPARMRAARLISSTSTTPARPRRSRLTTGRERSRHSTPPTTDVPPPYGTTVRPSAAAQSSTAATSSSVDGCATTSGAASNSPRRARTTSRNALPYVCVTRSERVHCAHMSQRGARPYGGFWHGQTGKRGYGGQLAVEREQRPYACGQSVQLLALNRRVFPTPAPPRAPPGHARTVLPTCSRARSALSCRGEAGCRRAHRC
jgi:hypothetical protein